MKSYRSIKHPNIGLHNRIKTHCAHGHEYNKRNTYWYRNQRQCKTCRLERNRRRIRGKDMGTTTC